MMKTVAVFMISKLMPMTIMSMIMMDDAAAADNVDDDDDDSSRDLWLANDDHDHYHDGVDVNVDDDGDRGRAKHDVKDCDEDDYNNG